MCLLIRQESTNHVDHAKTLPEAVEKAKALLETVNEEVIIYQPIRTVKTEARVVVEEYREPTRHVQEGGASV